MKAGGARAVRCTHEHISIRGPHQLATIWSLSPGRPPPLLCDQLPVFPRLDLCWRQCWGEGNRKQDLHRQGTEIRSLPVILEDLDSTQGDEMTSKTSERKLISTIKAKWRGRGKRESWGWREVWGGPVGGSGITKGHMQGKQGGDEAGF